MVYIFIKEEKEERKNNNNVDDAEYMRVKRLYEIVKEGSQTIRDFRAAYDAQKLREDSRRQQKPN